MHSYSQFLTTLHDESCPIGSIGRGVHYSVLRSLAWWGLDGRALHRPLIHDFAIIWDEDHDPRIIATMEEMLKRNLLYPVVFVGERKAFLSVLLSPDFAGDVDGYAAQVAAVAESQDDPWTASVAVWDRAKPSGMVDAADTVAVTYFQNIDNLWRLGHKDFASSDQEATKPAPPSMHAFGTSTAKNFATAMMGIYRRAREEAKYNATRFLQMLHNRGGLETAHILLHASNVSDGYTELWRRKRLDLTVEALVLQPEWQGLFTDDERTVAQKRLHDYGFNLDPR